MIDLDEIATVTESAAKVRTTARAASIRACRVLESALIHALQGEPLRGLANLGTASFPYYAAGVRGSKPDTRLRLRGWTLVVNPHGLLTMAKAIMDGEILGVRSEPVLDEELLAEDCERLATCLAILLPRHVARAKAAGQKFSACETFATKVVALFGEGEEGEGEK